MALVAAALGIGLAFVAGAEPVGEPKADDWKALFPEGADLRGVMGMPPGNKAFEVRDAQNNLLGWVFRTDHVNPKVKGFKGEIGLLTALDRQGRIAGVKVVAFKDTPHYMAKLKDAFYARLAGRAAAEPYADLDAVSGATFSSKAVIEDVFESARTVLACRSVKAGLIGAGKQEEGPR